MTGKNIQEQPWFTWAEEALRALYQEGPQCILLAARLESGDTMTAYYRADMEDIAVMVSHVKADMILDFIETNADVIKDILEDAEEDGEEEPDVDS